MSINLVGVLYKNTTWLAATDFTYAFYEAYFIFVKSSIMLKGYTRTG